MSLTLLALLMVPFALRSVLDPQGAERMYKNLVKNDELMFSTAFSGLVLALLIFSTTGLQLHQNRMDILFIMGLIIFLKSAFSLIPGLMAWKVEKFVSQKTLPALGFIQILLSLLFVALDTNLL